MYLSKLQDVFFKITKCICPNYTKCICPNCICAPPAGKRQSLGSKAIGQSERHDSAAGNALNVSSKVLTLVSLAHWSHLNVTPCLELVASKAISNQDITTAATISIEQQHCDVCSSKCHCKRVLNTCLIPIPARNQCNVM